MAPWPKKRNEFAKVGLKQISVPNLLLEEEVVVLRTRFEKIEKLRALKVVVSNCKAR